MFKYTNGARFFALEGLDGSGKSTQCALVRDRMIDEGYQVELVKDPDLNCDQEDPPIVYSAREILIKTYGKSHLDDFGKVQLHNIIRKNTEKRVENFLNKGITVISDRWAISGRVYQSSWRSYVYTGIIPVKYIILDITPTESLIRKNDLYSLNDLMVFKKNYNCGLYYRYIDGNKPKEEITEDIFNLIKRCIKYDR